MNNVLLGGTATCERGELLRANAVHGVHPTAATQHNTSATQAQHRTRQLQPQCTTGGNYHGLPIYRSATLSGDTLKLKNGLSVELLTATH
eukprot:4963375-Pyramimonas_sp.AAC.1